ncbi:hypothetical protein QMM42_13045 [Leptospira santarosai]|uniref:hypothetical protein n=1 Tax=Leptospira santarosai TaxID=28183 RepID=UPI0002487CE1|nr:hypothetical protein [Leptospira santarosai]MDI7187128.1 hypothetical protein [Leptospira santarosai]
MKLIYDFDEKDLSKRVKIEKEDGSYEYFPFYDIKIENAWSPTYNFKTWIKSKERMKYYQSEPVKIGQSKC